MQGSQNNASMQMKFNFWRTDKIEKIQVIGEVGGGTFSSTGQHERERCEKLDVLDTLSEEK